VDVRRSLFLLRQWSQYLLAENLVTGRDRQGTSSPTGSSSSTAIGPRRPGAKDSRTRLDETLDVKETADTDVVRMTYRVKVRLSGRGISARREVRRLAVFSYLLPFRSPT